MALYLVQHGKSLSKDQDPEQGLSRDGIIETEQMAHLAGKSSLQVSCIVHSGKTRARQTAELFADVLHPMKGLHEQEGLKPLDDAAAFAGTIIHEDNLMIVGHLPFLERLVSNLIAGDVEMSILKFQNSGVVCLDIDSETKSWFIRWAVMPENI